MKKIFLSLIAAMMTAGAWAIPARPGQFTVRQSDGTVLTLQMMGDEYFHYFLNVESGEKMLLGKDGDYHVLSEAAAAPMMAFAQQRRAESNARRMARLDRMRAASGVRTDVHEIATNPRPLSAGGDFNSSMKGEKKGLVILMEFPELKFQSQNTREAYERVFNQEGYSDYHSIGSVHDYFRDQSYGQFDLTFDVVGPYTSDHEMAYYGTDEIFPAHPEWGTINDRKACFLPVEAVKKANLDVNYKDYDWDGDGEVDQVYIIYPGYAQSSGAPANTIWPHESTLSQWGQYFPAQVGVQRLDGVKIDTYAMSQELAGTYGSTRSGIGTACHEFAHCIGFPDFYDINGAAFGMDAFDLLDNGSYNGPTYNCEVPAGFTAYERWMAGWLEPTVLSEGADIVGMKAIIDSPEAYVIYNTGNNNEYFLLENRQPKSWHKYVQNFSIPGGLLVTHVDFDKNAWASNQVNTTPSHQRMTIVPSGRSYGQELMGQIRTYESDYKAMLYPGSKEVTELTDATHASWGLRLFNRNASGSTALDAPIHKITASPDGTVSFIFKDGTDDGSRWTVTFDAGTGNTASPSWTQSVQNETLELPAATIDVPNWYFIGWSENSISTTSVRPENLLLPGTIYKPTANVTFHAVYGYSAADLNEPMYQKVDELQSGRSYVFATKGAETDLSIYAINSLALIPNTANNKASGKKIDVDFTGDVPTITRPDASIVWVADFSARGITLKNDGYYLTIESGGIGLQTAPAYLTWDPQNGLRSNFGGGNTEYYIHTSQGKFNVSEFKKSDSRVFAYQLEVAADHADIFSSTPSTDGINSISIEADAPHKVYDLQGRRLNNSHFSRGICIEDGRKVIR